MSVFRCFIISSIGVNDHVHHHHVHRWSKQTLTILPLNWNRPTKLPQKLMIQIYNIIFRLFRWLKIKIEMPACLISTYFSGNPETWVIIPIFVFIASGIFYNFVFISKASFFLERSEIDKSVLHCWSLKLSPGSENCKNIVFLNTRIDHYNSMFLDEVLARYLKSKMKKRQTPRLE